MTNPHTKCPSILHYNHLSCISVLQQNFSKRMSLLKTCINFFIWQADDIKIQTPNQGSCFITPCWFDNKCRNQVHRVVVNGNGLRKHHVLRRVTPHVLVPRKACILISPEENHQRGGGGCQARCNTSMLLYMYPVLPFNTHKSLL